MTVDRIEQAIDRIEAAMARIDAARLVVGSPPDDSSSDAVATRDPALRALVTEAIAEIDTLIGNLEK